jgi:Zn-dependent alcohol dehydrogenase
MRAALLEQTGQPLVIADDIDLEAPKAGEVRVRVHHCGVCHSDLSLVDGDLPPVLPIILGHEAAGIVEEVGLGVESLAVGDAVVLTACPPCGQCFWCLRGEWSLCVNSHALMTFSHRDGGTRLQRNGELVWRGVGVAAFAESVIMPEEGAIKIDPDVPLAVACVLGCAVQTGVGAVLNTAKVEEGSTVVVIGLGGIGLAVVQGAVIAGATRIVAVDPVEERRTAAKHFGATHTLDPTATDVNGEVFALTEGIGADYAFDAVGRSSLINQAINVIRPGGAAVMVGVPPLEDSFTMEAVALFITQQKRLLSSLLGSVNSRRDIPKLIDLWRAGRLDLEAMITAHRPLDDINAAFDDLRAARGIRTVIDIG